MSTPINIFITYKCNWFCKYCITNTHNQQEPDFDDIVKQANKVLPASRVNISGGEPGLVSYNKLALIIDILNKKNCNIRVYTNGEFFKHTNLLNKVNMFIYHCSENLDNIIDRVHINNISYNIVVSNSNKHNLDTFLKNNKHIKFSVSSADEKDVLNKTEGIKIWLKYKEVIYENSKFYLMNNHRHNLNNVKDDCDCNK